MTNKKSERRILILEPFYGGSHKRFIDTILPLSVDYDVVLTDTGVENHFHNHHHHEHQKDRSHKSKSSSTSSLLKWPKFKFTVYEMSAKKWHWRARTSALYLSQVIKPGADQMFDVIFTSSVLNLAELVALRPDIGRIPFKIIYFHENQLAYPVQYHRERDFQYGYNQILSCLVADQVVWNSKYNRNSFLGNIKSFLKIMPDYRPPDIDEMIVSIEQKSLILYYPIMFNQIPLMHAHRREKRILHIIWPHRWEHDKNPEQFFNLLFRLKEEQNIPFKVSILGQSYSEIPQIFEEARTRLSDEIIHWGFLDSRQDFYEVLASGNVCVSTAMHEFFGVSMLEAAYCGCYPLCPSRLVYPEIFPVHYLYESDDDLLGKLAEFGRKPESIPLPLDIAFDVFDWIYCQDEFRTLFSKNPPAQQQQHHQQQMGTSTSASNSTSNSSSPLSTLSSLTSKLKSTIISNHHHHHHHHHPHDK